MLTRFMPAITAFALATAAFAQPTQSWVSIINGSANNNDNCTAIETDALGNTIVAGYMGIAQPELVVPHLAVAKYAPDGQLLWLNNFTFGGDQSVSSDVAIDPNDQSVVVTGRAGLTSPWVVIKYAADGTFLWQRSVFGNTFFIRQPSDLKIDGASNIWMAVNDDSGGPSVAVIIKYAPDGSPIFSVQYDENALGAAVQDMLIDDATGEFYITGSVGDFNAGSVMMSVAKFSATGSRLWLRTAGSTQLFVGNAGQVITRDADGNIVAGGDFGLNSLVRNIGVMKIAPDGTELWTAQFDSAPNRDDAIYSLDVAPDRGIYICGGADNPGSGYDPLVFKLNSDGTLAWHRIEVGAVNAFNVFRDLEVDAAGNAYAVGDLITGGLGRAHIAKYSAAGQRDWEHFYAGPVGTSPGRWKYVSLTGAATPSPSIHAVGDIFIANQGQDITTIKLTQSAVPPPCPADFNNDALVNSADLSILLGSFGTSVSPGTSADANDDGQVNSADLSILLASFGSPC